MSLPTNLKAGLIALSVVLAFGSIGFVVIGEMTFPDALYFTVITITTLGYEEIGGPFDGSTRIWVVIVLISGMGAAIYTVTAMMEYGLEILIGSDYRRRRKMDKDLKRVKDHVIVCGYGRVGSTAAAALRRDDVPVVVVERRPKGVDAAIEAGFMVVDGDATRDEVLLEAGLDTCRSVVASLASASDNLVITLSVRAMRDSLPVTARAADAQTEKKLRLAGADSVVTPHQISGERIAALATQPGLAEFIDMVVRDSATEFRVKRFIVSDQSDSIGRTLADLDLRRDSGAMVIGIAEEGMPIRMNPDPNAPFTAGACVFGIGTADQLESLGSTFETA